MMPERCACLILEGASPGLAEPKERAERAEGDHALADLIEEKGVEAFFDYWERLPLFASQRDLPREIQAFIRELRFRQNPRGLANTVRGASVPFRKRITNTNTTATEAVPSQKRCFLGCLILLMLIHFHR